MSLLSWKGLKLDEGVDPPTDADSWKPPKMTGNIWVFPKKKYPKMDGENNGKPENPIKMDEFGGFPPIFGLTPICYDCMLGWGWASLV